MIATEEPPIEVLLENKSCFDYFPAVKDNSADLVLIDPPYDISRKTGFKSVKTGVERFSVSMDFGDWDWGFKGLDTVITEAYRALRKGGTLIVFYDIWKLSLLANWLEKSKFKQIRLIEWIKTNPVPLNSGVNYLTNSREIALVAVKGGKPTFNSKYDNGIYQYPICHEKGRFHPTQKPLALVKALVEKHSNPGDLVLDCFSGSGTTAVACIETGRNFSGCEISVEYWGKSRKRLDAQVNRKVLITGGAS